MSESRFHKNARERLLYTATSLEILVTAILAAWVIPHLLREEAPGSNFSVSVPVFLLAVAIHLVILTVLIRKIWLSRRGGRLRKAGLVVPGIILVLMSIMLMEMAGIYLEHQPVVISMAILLSVSAFFDLMTGIIMIMLPIRLSGNR